jgi:hypothetical protein
LLKKLFRRRLLDELRTYGPPPAVVLLWMLSL